MPDAKPAHTPSAPSNPLDPSEADIQRIRERAYHLWEQEGCPHGQDAAYWERARELDAMANNLPGMKNEPIAAEPIVEEATLQENLGEFPGRFTDQGEAMPTPATRKKAKAFREGAR
jgi:hypothetical protein